MADGEEKDEQGPNDDDMNIDKPKVLHALASRSV
jgi:hypothetical protein